MANQTVQRVAYDLKKASKSNDAPIWLRLSKLAQKPSRARRILNLNKISQLTKEGDVVVVPGKVLGTGNMSHKITLCSFSISNTAANKIIESGGKITTLDEMVNQFPTGKGVTLLG
ncbi:MAG: 50S ribosomal protein L18e [Nitrosopumilaceae archaeon]|nr:50S ribosomal protein L18e [Nitrosopumilaceae archaeon]